jgi:hypothetical protein
MTTVLVILLELNCFMGSNCIDEVVDWSLKRLVELMDDDNVSIDDYNSFVKEYGDFINIAMGEGFEGDGFMSVPCDR